MDGNLAPVRTNVNMSDGLGRHFGHAFMYLNRVRGSQRFSYIRRHRDISLRTEGHAYQYGDSRQADGEVECDCPQHYWFHSKPSLGCRSFTYSRSCFLPYTSVNRSCTMMP